MVELVTIELVGVEWHAVLWGAGVERIAEGRGMSPQAALQDAQRKVAGIRLRRRAA